MPEVSRVKEKYDDGPTRVRWNPGQESPQQEDPDKTKIWEKPRLVVDNTLPSREDETIRDNKDVGQEKEKLGPAVEGHSIASAKHERNEDSFFNGNGSVCVADGMGSHGGGDIASFLTTESFRSEMEQKGITVNSSREEVEKALLAAMAGANKAIDNSRKEETARIEDEITREMVLVNERYNKMIKTEKAYVDRIKDLASDVQKKASGTAGEKRMAAFRESYARAQQEAEQKIQTEGARMKKEAEAKIAKMRAENKMKDTMQGMKTTAVMAHEYRGTDGKRHILGASIGDSRGDLVREGQIRELTTEKDTLIRSIVGYVNKERVAAGKPPISEVNEDNPEDALPPEVLQWLYEGDRFQMEPLKSMLGGKSPERVKDLSAAATKALDGEGVATKKEDGTIEMDYRVQPHFFDEEIKDGDIYLISTDGRDNLSQAQVLEIVSNTPDTEELPRKIAEAAYKVAQNEGDSRSHDDDITVVAFHSLPEAELEAVAA
ncbi:MAG: hypothetical protein HQ530_03065 [Parcubacteria group bacterium]|nr:hypothetical protein [Parcubacteria group bacterium]